jgi:ribose 5-phosphate isomerase A
MTSEEFKRRAAERALALVQPGMRLGLGSGSTAAQFVALLGARVAAGLDVVGVATSQRTQTQAQALGIRMSTLDEIPILDLTVDGADEIDPGLRLIKGGGGALLREKIVAAASRRMVVIADASKQVATLGAFALPVEIVPFGMAATRRHIEAAAAACGCVGDMRLRSDAAGHAFVTDEGHRIVDCAFGAIVDPEKLAAHLDAVPGVVEHGLFIGLAASCIIAGAAGVHVLGEPVPL